MYSTATEKVRNLFNNDNASQENTPSTTQSSPPSQGSPSFPTLQYKIIDSLISQNANIALNKGNTPDAQFEAQAAAIDFHTNSFYSTLTDVGKELAAEKYAAEEKIHQLDTEIKDREKEESLMDKTIEEKRFIPTEEWTKKDRITLYACTLAWVVMFFWVEVTWSGFLHDELLYGWFWSLFFPLAIPAVASGSSLYLKRQFHASNPKLLRSLTVGAVVIALITFVLMMMFLGLENSMTKASIAGGIINGGEAVPIWVSLIRTVSQGIMEFAIDFVLVAVIFDIYDQVAVNRHEIVLIPNNSYLAHTSITEGLRKQKASLALRSSEIQDWRDSQHKAIQAALSNVVTRLKEKLS